MIKLNPYNALGKASHGWLKSSHHFSFADYYNPSRMGFGKLLVINDDWIKAGTGFPGHPHRNMEIITYVRQGAVTHQDNRGNKGVTRNGEVQVMSAGTGIVHSEYNMGNNPLVLYQIWIIPNKANVKPRWEAKKFPQATSEGKLTLLVSGYEEDKNKALFIYQEARLYGGKLNQGTSIEHPITNQAYVLASDGKFEVRDGEGKTTLSKGDGAEVTKSKSMTITALTDCEVVVIDVPIQ
jgi:redox-sensitive bicupin YhaK (pirin superfamily)